MAEIDSNLIVLLLQSNREVTKALNEFTVQMKEREKIELEKIKERERIETEWYEQNRRLLKELQERDKLNAWLIRIMLIVISALAGVNVALNT